MNKDFSLAYKDEELNSVITFDKIDESILNKIVPIREKKLDLKNINIELHLWRKNVTTVTLQNGNIISN